MKLINLLCLDFQEYGQFKEMMSHNVVSQVTCVEDIKNLPQGSIIHITDEAVHRENYGELISAMYQFRMTPAPALVSQALKELNKEARKKEDELVLSQTWAALQYGVPAGQIFMNISRQINLETSSVDIRVQPVRVGNDVQH